MEKNGPFFGRRMVLATTSSPRDPLANPSSQLDWKGPKNHKNRVFETPATPGHPGTPPGPRFYRIDTFEINLGIWLHRYRVYKNVFLAAPVRLAYLP